MRSSRNPFFRRAAVLLLAWLSPLALAFNAGSERWPAGNVAMHLQLGPANGTLIDGATSWNTVAEEALALWNAQLTNLKFTVVRDSTAPIAPDNGVNNVFWSPTVYGDAWDADTLAITLSYYNEETRRYTETDVVFNSTKEWNSYRGPLRVGSGSGYLNDFRRVALHEFGHALGLNHPDAIGQTVDAIMNARSSDTDNLTADDIAGARSIYDNPNTVPTALLAMEGNIGYQTSGSSVTMTVDRIVNAGDAASRTVRLEIWAMPQHLGDALPSGSILLAVHTVTPAIAANSTLTNVTGTTTYTAPPNGSYYVAMLLTEFTGASGTGYSVRDAIEFSNPLNVGTPSAPQITTQPSSLNVMQGSSATFAVVATGALPRTYQWRKDGNAITGATGTSYTIANAQPGDAGAYTVEITNSLGSVISNPAQLTVGDPGNPGRLTNMSIRTNAGTGANTLIVGLGIGGANTSGNKAVLIRGIGPTLGEYDVVGALPDAMLTMIANDVVVAENDDWAGSFDFNSVGAFPLVGTPPRDAAIYSTAIGSGTYSIHLTGKNDATGIALAEIYDATPGGSYTLATPRLVNVSARTHVGTGDNILIAGFNVGGSTPVRVLIRAAGPRLADFGVEGALANPQLEVFNSSNVKVAENDNWGGSDAMKAAFDSVGAFSFPDGTSADAALVIELQPGGYTVQVRGVNNTTGVALVEVYELP